MASSVLSTLGNAFVSASVAMIAQEGISLLIKGADALIHWDDNIIAKGQ